MAVHNPLAGVSMRAARWSAEHPGRAILGWFAMVAVAVGLTFAIPTQETADEDYWLGESGRAAEITHEAGLDEAAVENVLITSADGPLDEQQAADAAAAIRAGMLDVEGVDAVPEPQWNGDRSALLLVVQLARDHEDAGPLRDVTSSVASSHDDLRIEQAGDLTMDEGINDQVADDLAAAEGISVPITLVLMLLAFGALIAAGLPVLLAITSVAATIGVSAPVSHLVHAEPTVTSMIVLIGMAVGVDYSLFYLKREREERANGHGTLDAVEIAARTSGHSILVSGGAVIASMAGLYVMGGATFNSLATGSIIVVATAVLGSITVLPALLVKLGRWVDRPRVPLLWRLNRRIGQGGISRRILGPVVRRPVAALLVSVLVVAALAVPALGMKIRSGTLETLPDSIPEVATFERLGDEFPGKGTSLEVVVTGDAADVGAAVSSVNEAALATDDFVESGEGSAVTRTSEDGRTAVLTLALPYDDTDPRVDRAIGDLRSSVAPQAVGDRAVDVAVGGGAADALDYADHQRSHLPLVIGFILLLTMLMMGLSFRSLPLAVISTLLNLVSVGIAFGILTLVFQHGFGHELLDFDTTGFVIDWIPLFVMVVLVGLSMDYHVFVLSRVRELVRRGLPARLAVARGVSDTAGVVTSAAAVMVSVFAIFATLSMMEMKMMGVGLAAAILIDATLIRLVMLPAILVLLGDRAWWPTRPARPVGERVQENEPGFELASH